MDDKEEGDENKILVKWADSSEETMLNGKLVSLFNILKERQVLSPNPKLAYHEMIVVSLAALHCVRHRRYDLAGCTVAQTGGRCG